MKCIIMGRPSTLCLENFPWPISILKCNQQVLALMPGDEFLVTLKDADTVENLVMLLHTMKECQFTVCETKDCFKLRIKKHSTQS